MEKKTVRRLAKEEFDKTITGALLKEDNAYAWHWWKRAFDRAAAIFTPKNEPQIDYVFVTDVTDNGQLYYYAGRYTTGNVPLNTNNYSEAYKTPYKQFAEMYCKSLNRNPSFRYHVEEHMYVKYEPSQGISGDIIRDALDLYPENWIIVGDHQGGISDIDENSKNREAYILGRTTERNKFTW